MACQPAAPRTQPLPAPQKGPSLAAWPDFQEVSARLRSSVVSVITDGEREGRPRWGMASGVVVGPKKRILTNAHALQGASQVYVQQGQRPYLRAKVLASDPRVDLALLEVESPTSPALSELVPIQWRDSPLAPGQWAICMGHPYGLGHTVTVGVVSGTGRDYDDMGRPPGLLPEGWWSMVQVDAAINVGNSGGPVVDREGKAMGIATAIRKDGQGLAFAIPATMARHFVQEVETHQELRVAQLGAKVQEMGAGEVVGRLQSLKVLRVTPQGPAQQAGLRPGDIVLRTDTRELHRLSALAFEVQRRGVGASLPLWVRSAQDKSSPPRRLEIRLGKAK